MNSGISFRAERRMARARGFTILELVVVAAIVGVLSAMAMPFLGELLRNERIKTAVSDVNASIIYARSEAIKRNQLVAICASTDGANCITTGNFATGWIVFVDTDGDGAPAAAADILKKQDAVTGVAVTGTLTNLSYQRDGRLAAPVDDFVVSAAGATARCVRVGLSGRPNIKVGC